MVEVYSVDGKRMQAVNTIEKRCSVDVNEIPAEIYQLILRINGKDLECLNSFKR